VAYVTNDELAPSNMVIDFNDLKIMTKFIDTVLDHKYLIDISDPQCDDTFNLLFNKYGAQWRDHLTDEGWYKTVSIGDMQGLEEWERVKYESYVILNFVPTSENLAKWIFDIMSEKISKTGVKVHKIEWFETPKSRATYYNI
jgi:6-pyruvoyltetrahydropterin/6-carboxytetrahydropterin synthase